MTNKQPEEIPLSEKEAITIAAHFDGEARSVQLLEGQSDSEVKRELEGLAVSREYLNRWFESRFVDEEGKPYQAALWEKLEASLIAKPRREKSFLSTLFGERSLSWLTFYPRELAFASVVAVAVFALVVSYGAYDSKTEVAQSANVSFGSEPFGGSGYGEYNVGLNYPSEQTALRGDHIRLVADSRPLDLRSRSNAYRKTYSEVHAGVVDIDWINSDRAVSIINAGSMRTPPVIWIGKKKFEID